MNPLYLLLPQKIYHLKLVVKDSPYDYIESGEEKFDIEYLVFGGVMGIVSIILTAVLFSFYFIQKAYFLFNFTQYFISFDVYKAFILLWLDFGWFILVLDFCVSN